MILLWIIFIVGVIIIFGVYLIVVGVEEFLVNVLGTLILTSVITSGILLALHYLKQGVT